MEKDKERVSELLKLQILATSLMDGIKLPKSENEPSFEIYYTMLDKPIKYYSKALSLVFTNLDLERNQKIVRELKSHPIPTIAKIGKELYENEQVVKESNVMASSDKVVLFNQFDYVFMSRRKINEFNQVVWEDVKDDDGIIYVKMKKEWEALKNTKTYPKIKIAPNLSVELYDIKEILENSERATIEQVWRG